MMAATIIHAILLYITENIEEDCYYDAGAVEHPVCVKGLMIIIMRSN